MRKSALLSLIFFIFLNVFIGHLMPKIVYAVDDGTITVIDSTNANYKYPKYSIDIDLQINNFIVSGIFKNPDLNCGLSITGVIVPGNTIDVELSSQRIEALPAKDSINACDPSIADELTGTITLVNSSAITSPPADSPDKQVVVWLTSITRTSQDTGINVEGIDLTKAPKNDKITIKNMSDVVIAEKLTNDADRAPGYVAYNINFEGVVPGKYKICSEIAGTCKEVEKKPGEVLRESISVDSKKFQGLFSEDIADANDATDKLTCESNIPAVGWIICEAMEAAIGGLGFLETAIQNQLTFDLDNINGTGNKGSAEIRAGSDSIKIIANTAFAIGILWIVLSQAITGGGGSGFFGAYEAKKVLPKLIAGVIVANFSWDLANLMLKISNSLGAATKSIMLSPFGGNISVKIDTADTWSLGLAGLGTGVAVFFGFFAITPILITAAAAIIIGYFALIFRKAVIIALVTFAPIALVISPFAPNITKRWMNMLRNMIFMYPIIMAMISAFAIMAYLLDIQAQATTGIPSIALKLAAIACLFAPYFMIVTLFKIMGDVLGKLAGSAKSMGDGFSKNFGQRRLEGNIRKQERDLKRNWRMQRKKEKALDRSFGKMTYGSQEGENNLFKKGRARFIQAQQSGIKPGGLSRVGTKAVGKIPLVGGRAGRYIDGKMSEREEERTHMMSIAEDQVLESSVKKAQQQASYKSFSAAARPYTDSSGVVHRAEVLDSDGRVIAGAEVNTLNDAYGHLAAGRTVRYRDVKGSLQTMDGSDSGIQYMAADAVKEDATQAYKLEAIIEAERAAGRSNSQVAMMSQSSLNYMIQKGSGSLVKSAPSLMNVPQQVSLGAGSTAEAITAQKDKDLFREIKDESGNVIATKGSALELLAGNNSSEINQVLGEFAAMQDPTNTKSRFNKSSHNNAMANAIENHFVSGGGPVKFNGTDYHDAAGLRAAIGI